MCSAKSSVKAEREAQKIVQQGMLSKACKDLCFVSTDQLQLENVRL